MNEDVRFCTTDGCNRLTTLFLCTTCIVELADLIQDVRPILERIDLVIYRMSVTSNPGSGGGGVAGSKPSMNLDAYMLKAWLHQLPESAHAEAMTNPEAGITLYMARDWIGQSRDLVWGPEDKRVYGRCEVLDFEDHDTDQEPAPCAGQLIAHPDDATVKCPECQTVHRVSEILEKLKAKARGEPMSPRAARELLQRKARVVVSVFDFKNYAKLGHIPYVLDRVTTDSRPAKMYYPGDVLDVHLRMRERRRHIG